MCFTLRAWYSCAKVKVKHARGPGNEAREGGVSNSWTVKHARGPGNEAREGGVSNSWTVSTGMWNWIMGLKRVNWNVGLQSVIEGLGSLVHLIILIRQVLF